VHCNNVGDDRLADVLQAGWRLEAGEIERRTGVSVDELHALQRQLNEVDVFAVRPQYVELVRNLRKAGIPVSDRRAVKLQRLVAASALLCGRRHANPTDLWVLRYIWDADEQREVIAAIVDRAVEQADPEAQAASHPRARGQNSPDPEELARDLSRLAERWSADGHRDVDRAVLRDQLSLLAGRCQWLPDAQQRSFLAERVEALWQQWGGAS
jgi:MoxR-like ATPase